MRWPRPSALALQQRGEDAAVRIHAGGDVGDRRAGLGTARRACRSPTEARLALDQQVVGLLVAIRSGVGRVVAVAGDVADDQRRASIADSSS